MSMGALKVIIGYGAKAIRLTPLLVLTASLISSPAHSVGLVDGNALEGAEEEIRRVPGMPANGQFCQIVLTQDGTMVPNVEGNRIGSLWAGGRPGQANVTTTNSSYQLSVDVPTAFDSAPPRGNDDVSFDAQFLGTGATNFGSTGHANLVRMHRGTTNVRTHIQVLKNSGTFPGGNYSATLTLRCE